jgi:hypothetical protein
VDQPVDAGRVDQKLDNGENMKITMMRVLSIKEELDALFMKDIPIAASWKISKFIRQIENEYNDFERNRVKILEKHLDKESGKVPEDKQKDVQKEMEELLDVEVELNVEPIDISELGDISVPPMALAKMAFMFKEPEPEMPNVPGMEQEE